MFFICCRLVTFIQLLVVFSALVALCGTICSILTGLVLISEHSQILVFLFTGVTASF